MQVGPQLIPTGLEVTVPVPSPALVTVSVLSGGGWLRLKLASSRLALVTSTLQLRPVEHAPPGAFQPANVEPAEGVRVITPRLRAIAAQRDAAVERQLPREDGRLGGVAVAYLRSVDADQSDAIRAPANLRDGGVPQTVEQRGTDVQSRQKRRSPPTFRSPGSDGDTLSPGLVPVKAARLDACAERQDLPEHIRGRQRGRLPRPVVGR